MTKQYFQELAEYNFWANSMVCSWLEQITDEQWNKEIISSFSSIQQTVLHIISSENAWLQRFNKVQNIQFLLSENYQATKNEHIALWIETSNHLKEFINNFEGDIFSTLTFKRFNGDEYSMPYYQLFAHIVNHTTLHRGQLVTMLRQAGFTKIQSTDLISFYRK